MEFTSDWREDDAANVFIFLTLERDISAHVKIKQIVRRKQSHLSRAVVSGSLCWLTMVRLSPAVVGFACFKRVARWPWGITYGSILGWMNIHLLPILMFTGGTGRWIFQCSAWPAPALAPLGSQGRGQSRRADKTRRPEPVPLEVFSNSSLAPKTTRSVGFVGFLRKPSRRNHCTFWARGLFTHEVRRRHSQLKPRWPSKPPHLSPSIALALGIAALGEKKEEATAKNAPAPLKTRKRRSFERAFSPGLSRRLFLLWCVGPGVGGDPWACGMGHSHAAALQRRVRVREVRQVAGWDPDLVRRCGVWDGTQMRKVSFLGGFGRKIDGDSWLTWWLNHLPGKPIYFPEKDAYGHRGKQKCSRRLARSGTVQLFRVEGSKSTLEDFFSPCLSKSNRGVASCSSLMLPTDSVSS